MFFQFLTGSVEDNGCMIACNSVFLCNNINRFREKISSDKNIPVTFRQRPHKCIYALSDILCVILVFNVRLTCKTFRQLIKHQYKFTAASFLSGICIKTVKSKISSDSGKVHSEISGILRRNCIPRFEPCIIHTLLCIFLIMQNVIRHRKTVLAVF